MYRAVLECTGIDPNEGEKAAHDIQMHFREHRRHHQNVTCSFHEKILTLIAANDFDPNGLALMDELSDCMCAFVKTILDGDIVVVSVTKI